MDCGHALSRTKGKAIFVDADNLRPLCKICNQANDQDGERFQQYLKAEMGTEYLEELINKSRTTVKRSRSELIEMIHEYRTKINSFQNNKP